MSPSHPDDTTELTPFPQVGHDAPPPPSREVRVDLAGLSDIGKRRPTNDDHYVVVRFGRYMHTLLTNVAPDDSPPQFEQHGYGLALADGMGGMAAGDLASRLALTTLFQLIIQTQDWQMGRDEPQVEEIKRRTAGRLQKVAQTLSDEARADPALSGMGTTMILAASLGTHLLIAHVGDSRAYLLRQDRLIRLTRDQTVAQSLADAGVIAPGDVSHHPMRHILTSALGGDARTEVEFRTLWLMDGDRLLLCSDGLTEMVDDATIGQTLRASPTSAEACRSLVDQALDNGGKDNVTVVVAAFTVEG